MLRRTQRPIALALVCSFLLHLLGLKVYLRVHHSAVPAAVQAADSPGISVALRTAQSSPTETGADAGSRPAPEAAPDKPESPRPSQPALPPRSQPGQPEIAEPAPVEPLRPHPRESVAARLPELNPVPVLREEFGIDIATLALQAPMASQQQEALQSALNHFTRKLPDWTDPSRPLRWEDGEREYRITVEEHHPATATGLERAVLAIRTEINGLPVSARLPVKRMAFSHFAQVVDRWNPDVRLAGDQIVGRFHSNSEVWVFSDSRHKPLVTGPTTVAGRVNLEGRGRRAEVFASGVETRAARMPLPSQAFPWRDHAAGVERVHEVEVDSRIVFTAAGGYHWYPVDNPGQRAWASTGSTATLIVAHPGVKLQVEGTVAGSFLVYSPTRITVTGSLTYANSPRDGGASRDFLGLVSDRNVEIAGPDVTGPGDIELFAAVFAGRQFRIRQIRARDGGVLRIFGSVTAGTLSATEPRFRTRLEFDPRLEDQRPAYFPLTNRYLLDDPAPAWTIENATAQRQGLAGRGG